jgi:hypothetical protein
VLPRAVLRSVPLRRPVGTSRQTVVTVPASLSGVAREVVVVVARPQLEVIARLVVRARSERVGRREGMPCGAGNGLKKGNEERKRVQKTQCTQNPKNTSSTALQMRRHQSCEAKRPQRRPQYTSSGTPQHSNVALRRNQASLLITLFSGTQVTLYHHPLPLQNNHITSARCQDGGMYGRWMHGGRSERSDEALVVGWVSLRSLGGLSEDDSELVNQRLCNAFLESLLSAEVLVPARHVTEMRPWCLTSGETRGQTASVIDRRSISWLKHSG